MGSRVTEWRHRTCRSKKRLPKGPVNYRAVAIYIAKKYFGDIWRMYPGDILQEIEILILEAGKKRIKGSNKFYGNGKDRMGLVSYSRACQARFYQVRKNYGLYRNKTFFSLIDAGGEEARRRQ